MLGGKNRAAIVRRKLRAVIDRHPERGGMRLDKSIRHWSLVLEFRLRAAMLRIFIGADVVPGPAVERALAYARDIIGRHVVAQSVAFVGRAPQRAVRRDGRADAVAQPGGEGPFVSALRI